MSSTPPTPDTLFDSHERLSTPSSPLSSPPATAMMTEDGALVSEAMKTEEKRMKQEARRRRAQEQLEAQASNDRPIEDRRATLAALVSGSKKLSGMIKTQFEISEAKRRQERELAARHSDTEESTDDVAAATPQRRPTRASAVVVEDAQAESSVRTEPNASAKAKLKQPRNEEATNQYMRDLEQTSEDAAQDPDGVSTVTDSDNLRSADQPTAVTGGVMRPYQLEGLYWLRSLYENGVSGILADEMGLGKTIQTIALIAHLRSKETYGPFLIVAPLSTLSNWIEEFQKWTPSIPTVLYHGTPKERADIRRNRLALAPRTTTFPPTFPVVCTSYEIVMNDRKHLEKFTWKYLIVDEGHRMKNKNCRLVKELKSLKSVDRLLITGTPLQNNILELWALLHFVMSDIFEDFHDFESLFDFSNVTDTDVDPETLARLHKSNFVKDLHEILKPFLLRRVKSDVETDLPKKREYILYAPLTAPQKELYRQILNGNSRAYLEQQAIDRINTIKDAGATSSQAPSRKRKAAARTATPNKSAKSSRGSTPASSFSTMPGRKRTCKSYKELTDAEYFANLEKASNSDTSSDEEEQEELDRANTIGLAKKEMANKKLQNPVMQLRLVCNSPHHFYWPWKAGDKDTDDEIPDSTLVTHSGKMLMLERLVPYLFEAGHKVLIFSQFKTQLDILHDWAALQHEWLVCRIDGSVAQATRRDQIQAFNTNPNVRLFLLSTRAGGQGINLTAADTVILFDSDWNPQQDLQAQDRAHRIGQTRPVIVYRLATKGTVEQTMLEKADGKRRLEKLVIQKGKFRNMLREKAGDTTDADDLADVLVADDFEGYDPGDGVEQLLTDEDLAILTDRSDAAYERAAKGLDAGEKFKTVEPAKEDVLDDVAMLE